MVLACPRRAGAGESALLRHGAHGEVIRFRCVGQVDAGMLLDLRHLGARAVLVAGCATERCRFGSGAALAAEQVERAKALIGLLGNDSEFVWSDWSKDRAGDPLDAPVLHMLADGPKPIETEAESVSH